MPVVTWLLSQQNENGGFASTSDTYVAVDALERFSKKLRIPNRGTDISVQYSYLKTVRRLQVMLAIEGGYSLHLSRSESTL